MSHIIELIFAMASILRCFDNNVIIMCILKVIIRSIAA